MSQFRGVGPASGFVFRIERDRGPQWYAKWREPGGRQVKRRIGPAWTGRGRPDPGFFTKRTAEEWLRATLAEVEDDSARGVDRDVTFATAAAEWLRYVEQDRAVKPSTLRDYRSGLTYHLLPAFGARRLVDIAPAELERWRFTLAVSPRTKNKLIVCVGSIYRRAARVYGCAVNPAASVERLRVPRQLDVDVFSPEEVWALVRAAESDQDAAIPGRCAAGRGCWATPAFGAWWPDPVVGVLIAGVAVKEGLEAWRCEGCCVSSTLGSGGFAHDDCRVPDAGRCR